MTNARAPKAVAYKILTREAMSAFERDGVFAGSAADLADGFIHMSTASQLAATLASHYAGQRDLVIACVDLDRVGDALRWEISRGGAPFPHLYASLPLAAIIATGPVMHAPDGSVVPPA